MSDRDYYCSKKFTFLKIDLESKTTYNCHAAKPHQIDFEWLQHNPGQLFNTPINLKERQMMLSNQRNDSCEQNCWPAEDRGLPSPRLMQQGQFRSHDQIVVQPRMIDITLNTDCNLTCSYCCKEFSTSWRNDIIKNGSYDIESESHRYSLTSNDMVLSKISQAQRFSTKSTGKILDEIACMSATTDTTIITGGEPFLSKYWLDLVQSNSHTPVIKIFTGLGVDYKRFERIVDALVDCKNVVLSVSADSTESNYEFNRYGMKWSDFLRKIDLLSRKNIKFGFHTVISNLTVCGFPNLFDLFADKSFRLECVYNPNFLAPYVMDNETKQHTVEQIQNLSFDQKQTILDSLQSQPTEQQRQDLSKFLHEFIRRRPDLNWSIFPKTFRQWIQHVV